MERVDGADGTEGERTGTEVAEPISSTARSSGPMVRFAVHRSVRPVDTPVR
jgi:hypothetical protein